METIGVSTNGLHLITMISNETENLVGTIMLSH